MGWKAAIGTLALAAILASLGACSQEAAGEPPSDEELIAASLRPEYAVHGSTTRPGNAASLLVWIVQWRDSLPLTAGSAEIHTFADAAKLDGWYARHAEQAAAGGVPDFSALDPGVPRAETQTTVIPVAIGDAGVLVESQTRQVGVTMRSRELVFHRCGYGFEIRSGTSEITADFTVFISADELRRIAERIDTGLRQRCQ